MPIVISEFEIVPEPMPALQPAGPPPTAEPLAPRPPTPHDVALAIGHELRRSARLTAD
jgi:hypothetical protein